jgi:hypothetical protein
MLSLPETFFELMTLIVHSLWEIKTGDSVFEWFIYCNRLRWFKLMIKDDNSFLQSK